jgi:uncharacterized RDD family membrane protein YckC
MRCPKCHYLSFDPEPRCRNCGYGLSLEEADVRIHDDDASSSPFADLAIHEPADQMTPAAPPRARTVSAPPAPPAPAPRAPAPPAAPPRPESPFAGLAGVTPNPAPPSVEAPRVQHASPRPRPLPTSELPLFVRGTASPELARVDEPLVRLPAETRPPLAVRRTVESPKPKPVDTSTRRTAGPLDADLLASLNPVLASRPKAAGAPHATPQEDAFRAGAGKRLLAAVIDGTLLAGLSSAVVWLTLRWIELPLEGALNASVLLPTAAFLCLLVIGYLVLFTVAGGQTPGKMAAGIRVIGDAPDDSASLGFGQALARAALALPSVLLGGLGFLPALVGDQRAIHDRLAHTRVVRA